MFKPHSVLVTGVSGQVGGALLNLLGEQAVAAPRAKFDLAKPETLTARLDKIDPAVVINAAAYTAVDQAESDAETAFTVNAASPGVIAQWCAARDIPFVHFSTDYVFAGDGTRPWQETDAVAPLNVYGASKLRGEQAIAQAGGRWLIFRTSWVYDAHGKNFFTTMLRLGRERESLRVVNDQHGAPTYAPHLAEASLSALENALPQPNFPSGIYHLAHAGATTWDEFAQSIFQAARELGVQLSVKNVEGIATKDYPTPARRPANSRLATDKAQDKLKVSLPPWQAGLGECLAQWAKEHRQ